MANRTVRGGEGSAAPSETGAATKTRRKVPSPGENVSDDDDAAVGSARTLAYLRRLYECASFLSRPPNSSSSAAYDDDDEDGIVPAEDGESLADAIARRLLEACDPSLIGLDVPDEMSESPDEPARRFFENDDDDVGDDGDGDGEGDEDEDEDETGSDEEMGESSDGDGDGAGDDDDDATAPNLARRRKPVPRVRRRSDALRLVLRSMSPVALDVGARAASAVVRSRDVDDDDDGDGDDSAVTSARAFVLFSAWLPISPQLTPVVSDLFGWDRMGCPFDAVVVVVAIPPGGGGGAAGGASDADAEESAAERAIKRRRPRGRSLAAEDERGGDGDGDDNGAGGRARQVVAEAAYSLCRHYDGRGENETLRQFAWGWGGLFRLLETDADGDGERGPYTPESLTDWFERRSEEEGPRRENWSGLAPIPGVTPSDLRLALSSHRGYHPWPYNPTHASRWNAGRAVGHFLGLPPSGRADLCDRLGVREERVPWSFHPWLIEEEEEGAQGRMWRGMAALWRLGEADDDADRSAGGTVEEIPLPTARDVRSALSVPRAMVHLGDGVLLPRRGSVLPPSRSSTSRSTRRERSDSIAGDDEDPNAHPRQPARRNLLLTPTTRQNLVLLGAALCTDPYPPPILVCGSRGSGKSSLVRELARYCSSVDADEDGGHGSHGAEGSPLSLPLLELHVDDDTDSRTLLGTYASTDVPGEFTWRPGALTVAARSGRWVLLEDADSCPVEVQAALVRLLEDRILPLASCGGGG